jgi:hypothetical protein
VNSVGDRLSREDFAISAYESPPFSSITFDYPEAGLSSEILGLRQTKEEAADYFAVSLVILFQQFGPRAL